MLTFQSPVPREVVEDRDRALTYDETSRDSDFISFDHSRHIPAELEDEAIKFDEWVKVRKQLAKRFHLQKFRCIWCSATF